MGIQMAGTTVRLAAVGLAVAVACSVGSTTATAGAVGRRTALAGTATCAILRGTIRISPALHVAPVAATTVTFKLRLAASGCTATDGARFIGPSVSTMSVGGPSTCADLLTGGSHVPATWTTRWAIRGAAKSVTQTAGVTGAPSATGAQQWSFPGATQSASGSGSYPGDDAGASSSFTVTSRLTTAEILAVCASRRGLSYLRVASGTVAIG